MRQGLAFALAAFLLFLASVAAIRGLADAYSIHARRQLSRWSGEGKVPRLLEAAPLFAGVRRAIDLDGRNPTLISVHAYLYKQVGYSMRPVPDISRSYNEQALEAYRIAAPLRPAQAGTWANIALLKARLNQLDTEFSRAMDLSLELGPWQWDVQYNVAEAGFIFWSRLPERQKDLLENLARATKAQPRAILLLADTYGKARLVCDLKPRVREALAICNR